jgi:acid phosphatase family membrane protein YuiD
MTRFFLWMQRDEGWKTLLATVYAVICLFDFIVVPSYFAYHRQRILNDFENKQLKDLSLIIQEQVVKNLSIRHSPYTLEGAGMFHIAFGALLTGSAISKIKEGTNSDKA